MRTYTERAERAAQERFAWERDQIAALDALIQEVSVFLHAPPLIEANRRAALIRKVLAENPER